MLVQKFGGTSVANPDRIREVADHVARCRRRGHDVVLVVSAMGKETDDLLRLANDVSKTQRGREMDMLVTAGERKAIAVVCMALHDAGVDAVSFTGSQAGFITDTNHRNAKILEIRADRVRETIAAGQVPVVAGSQGVSTENDVTFLGRGGSDTTAVALAQVLDADSCELYTDVSGVFTTDPRICPEARKMAQVSFDELMEMTAVGCPKPAMRSVEVARRYGVNLHVRSAFTWEPGTWVSEAATSELLAAGDASAGSTGQSENRSDMEAAVISGVVPDTSQAKVTIAGVPDQPGIAAKVFEALAAENVNVDMIVQNVSENGVTDISFTIPREDLAAAEAVMETLRSDIGATGVTLDATIGRVSLVGAGMASNPGVAATMFATLAQAGINIGMISTSAIRVSCVVAEDQVDDAVNALHAAFELA